MNRFPENPLLTPKDLSPTREDLQVMCTFNPAAVKHNNEYLLLVRVGEHAPEEKNHVKYIRYNAGSATVEVKAIRKNHPHLDTSDPRGYFFEGQMLLTSLSHLRLARSKDGRKFTFDPAPAIFPSEPYEAYGCEDPRITFIDNKYYITYTAVSNQGVTVALASTTDFTNLEKQGIIFHPYQKDVCLFPEKVRGMYVCRHRPYKSEFNPSSIWTAYSPDLLCWGHHTQTLRPTPGTWECDRVGAGAPPILTKEGWLEIYHGADEKGRYYLGAMLSDPDHPERILNRSTRPVLEPEADYEIKGVYDECIFSNGMILEKDNSLIIYYGAADRICAAVETSVDEMLAAARSGPPIHVKTRITGD